MARNCQCQRALVSLPKVVPSTIERPEVISRHPPPQDHATRVFVPVARVGPVSVVKPPEQDGSARMKKKPAGLYANIAAKRDRIAAGSGERMRKTGSKGSPTAEAFRKSALTVKNKPKGKM